MGDMADYYSDQYELLELERSLSEIFNAVLRRRLKEDWHTTTLDGEPSCSNSEWRTKDRSKVLKMSEMEYSHLQHCLRFANKASRHGIRRIWLMKELRRRKKEAKLLSVIPSIAPLRK